MATLGDVLNAGRFPWLVAEKDWVRLVDSVAIGNPLALHALYERTCHLVFTLIARIVRDPHIAEELALEVYDDLWRGASGYDSASGTVLAWIMKRARRRAVDRLRFEQVKQGGEARPAGGTADGGEFLRPAPALQGRLAQRLAAETGGRALLPASSQWIEPEWVEVAPGVACKLLANDSEGCVVGMLVRLAPGGEYPPHRHAGVEELHLLHGELRIDERKLAAGDYSRAEPGTEDKRVWSEAGCTCVLVTSTDDLLR